MNRQKTAEASKSMAYFEWAMKSQKATTTAHLLELAKSDLKATPEDFDADPWRLNCRNGTVDLKLGQLMSHSPQDMITKVAGCEFKPNAIAPQWDAFLNRVLGGSEALTTYLQKSVGYSLTGQTTEQCFFILYGSGSNGKSTFTGMILEMLGEYGGAIPSSLLTAQKFEQHPTVFADLFQLRMAVSSEVKSGSSWDEERLKGLSGGDRIKARRMNENFWEFEPTHKLWLCVNHAPTTKDNSEGFWRRVRMVPFTTTIPKEERDTNLQEKLRAELPGILAWAIKGCLLWQQEGLGTPKEVKDATESYWEHQDPFGRFLKDVCERPGRGDGIFQVQSKDLLSAQHDWALNNEERQLSSKELKAAASEHGIHSKRSDGMQYQGIRLKRA